VIMNTSRSTGIWHVYCVP